jgi:hypothetical protein
MDTDVYGRRKRRCFVKQYDVGGCTFHDKALKKREKNMRSRRPGERKIAKKIAAIFLAYRSAELFFKNSCSRVFL